MAKRQPSDRSPISWERAQEIFGNPQPPREVWERQFDYFDEELKRLAKTPFEQIDFADLWYYHHDLAYAELQPELFNYLFPVCLMDWHDSFMKNEPCSHGDSEFHYGVYRGNVLEKMVTPTQRQAIYAFFRDSFLERLDTERGFAPARDSTGTFGWISRFNSVAIIAPVTELLWTAWWRLETTGRAIAALQYCSGLMYLEGENPLSPAWTKERGGGGPYLWEDDSLILDAGWSTVNLDFLSRTLNLDFVKGGVTRAVARLKGEPECEAARQLEADLPRKADLITLRVTELPVLLSVIGRGRDWSV